MKVHLIGIGGSGMSAIARVLHERGHLVTGSDHHRSPLARTLERDGVVVYHGHAPEYIQNVDVVVRSSAIPEDNVELRAALKAGLPVYKRAEFLGQLTAGHQTIAVAGTHGKTTTSAMIAWALTSLKQDPSFVVGGVVENLATNAHAGSGRFFVIEADEYDHMFLGLEPAIAVVTNVEYDHPDFFTYPEDFYKAFTGFVDRLGKGGALIACTDDPGAASLLERGVAAGRSQHSYGLLGSPEYQATDLKVESDGTIHFSMRHRGISLTGVRLRVPGEHNVLNALAALAAIDVLGLSTVDAGAAIGEFQGTGRRFQVRGDAAGVTVIDDYAHHPTEIRVTLAAARQRYPARRLWAVWQPHTFTRTRRFSADFVTSFVEADHVLVTEVFAAREPDPGDFSVGQLVSEMRHQDAQFVPTLELATSRLLEKVQDGDVVLVLSAGDADQISAMLLAGLQARSQQNV